MGWGVRAKKQRQARGMVRERLKGEDEEKVCVSKGFHVFPLLIIERLADKKCRGHQRKQFYCVL